jgi:hypothetical protein
VRKLTGCTNHFHPRNSLLITGIASCIAMVQITPMVDFGPAARKS